MKTLIPIHVMDFYALCRLIVFREGEYKSVFHDATSLLYFQFPLSILYSLPSKCQKQLFHFCQSHNTGIEQVPGFGVFSVSCRLLNTQRYWVLSAASYPRRKGLPHPHPIAVKLSRLAQWSCSWRNGAAVLMSQKQSQNDTRQKTLL
jgi:hypothetical protein